MSSRSYLSGAKKRKLTEEKKLKESAVLEKIPKLTNFFQRNETNLNRPEDEPGTSVELIEPSERPSEAENLENLAKVEESNNPDSSHEVAAENPNRSADPGIWEEFKQEDVRYWVQRGPTDCQNVAGPFEASQRRYETESTFRYCSKNMFFGKKPNGERNKREWLVYSPLKGCVYCFVCKLFLSLEKSNKLAREGFDDWKNGYLLQQHENNSSHRECMLIYLQRREEVRDLPDLLETQLLEEKNYWRDVLKRVVAVIITLAERGLSFRGSNAMFGALDNGNFLGLLELVAQFDPFLRDHIVRYGNAGRGVPSYLSKTICEELINIMGQKVRTFILEEMSSARYFSISVDSTPDISHVDQLSVILRYVSQNDGKPVERFLSFLPLDNHTGEKLAEQVLKFISEDCNLDFQNCRGQSYDNAANMSGKYKGMQARLLNLNENAIYVPCAAHSLNLVGESAVKCCFYAVDFFSVMQLLYNFFSASTHRWSVLNSCIGDEKTLKSLSETRWEAHANATNAVYNSYSNIIEALESIGDDVSEKGDTRHDATSIANRMQRLEFASMLVLWNSILTAFRSVSKTLQAEEANLQTCAFLYESLQKMLEDFRDKFDDFEEKAKQLLPDVHYAKSQTRRRARKNQANDGNAPEVNFPPRDDFRIKGFLLIIDTINCEIEKRGKVYMEVFAKFTFLNDFSLSDDDYKKAIENLVCAYSNDLQYFFSELKQFQFYVTSRYGDAQKSHYQLYQILKKDQIADVFSNVEIALRIFLTMMITNCSAERSFSQLKRIKAARRATMRQERLDMLSLLCIESDILKKIDFDDVIGKFSELKCRKKFF